VLANQAHIFLNFLDQFSIIPRALFYQCEKASIDLIDYPSDICLLISLGAPDLELSPVGSLAQL
jgi:hypothetical protein